MPNISYLGCNRKILQKIPREEKVIPRYSPRVYLEWELFQQSLKNELRHWSRCIVSRLFSEKEVGGKCISNDYVMFDNLNIYRIKSKWNIQFHTDVKFQMYFYPAGACSNSSLINSIAYPHTILELE
jgi:hypothetical protein